MSVILSWFKSDDYMNDQFMSSKPFGVLAFRREVFFFFQESPMEKWEIIRSLYFLKQIIGMLNMIFSLWFTSISVCHKL